MTQLFKCSLNGFRWFILTLLFIWSFRLEQIIVSRLILLSCWKWLELQATPIESHWGGNNSALCTRPVTSSSLIQPLLKLDPVWSHLMQEQCAATPAVTKSGDLLFKNPFVRLKLENKWSVWSRQTRHEQNTENQREMGNMWKRMFSPTCWTYFLCTYTYIVHRWILLTNYVLKVVVASIFTYKTI